MTTEHMELYSIEIDDVLLIEDEVYEVIDKDYDEESVGETIVIVLTLLDEEGYSKKLKGLHHTKVTVIVD
jgi:hypothetical protein